MLLPSFYLFILSCFILLFPIPVMACETCALTRLGQQVNALVENKAQGWFAEYFFEQQNYVEKDAHEAHTLHHQGHDFHDKSSDDTHHVQLGYRMNERLSWLLDTPYLVRRSIEVDSHAHLGFQERAEGLGDMQLKGQYDVIRRKQDVISLIAGVKFPTGSTKELNSAGALFEPELQLGSGSYDYLWGFSYQGQRGRVGLLLNSAYIMKTPGAAEFELGDVFSSTVGFDYTIFQYVQPGVRLNYQHEGKHRQNSSASADSGGDTWLMGPSLSVKANGVEVFGNYLAPVHQNLGGVHQELDYTYVVGAKVGW